MDEWFNVTANVVPLSHHSCPTQHACRTLTVRVHCVRLKQLTKVVCQGGRGNEQAHQDPVVHHSAVIWVLRLVGSLIGGLLYDQLLGDRAAITLIAACFMS
jgi:hypothetical protein